MLLEFLNKKTSLNAERIYYGQHPTPFGLCLIGLITNKICYLAIINSEHPFESILNEFKNEWKLNEFYEDQQLTKNYVDKIFQAKNETQSPDLKLLLKGTPFQFEVWKALLEIPRGTTVGYNEIAVKLGRPKSSRAVAGQIARNSIMYLIPCHRVIRKSGNLGGYRYGVKVKEDILAYEAI